MQYNKFMPEDRVAYVGSKFAKELHGKIGWIVFSVDRDPDMYTVEFDVPEGDYIMHARNLAPWKDLPNKKEDKNADKVGGIEIRRNRRRTSEEES